MIYDLSDSVMSYPLHLTKKKKQKEAKRAKTPLLTRGGAVRKKRHRRFLLNGGGDWPGITCQPTQIINHKS